MNNKKYAITGANEAASISAPLYPTFATAPVQSQSVWPSQIWYWLPVAAMAVTAAAVATAVLVSVAVQVAGWRQL